MPTVRLGPLGPLGVELTRPKLVSRTAHTLCFRMMEEAGRIGKAIGIPATVSIEEMFDRARALGAHIDALQ